MSSPAFPFWGLLVGLGFIGVALLWAGTAASDLVAAIRGRAHGSLALHGIGLAVILLIAAAVPTFAPLRFRFALSETSMQKAADTCLDSPPLDEPCDVKGRTGLYNVIVAVSRGDDVIFYVSGMSFMDSGFVYARDGRPPASSPDFEQPDYVNLGGGWFAFTASS